MRSLKDIYITLKQQIENLDSSCVNVSMSQVLERFIHDDEDKKPFMELVSTISVKHLRQGVLLHDLSGLGLYTIGPLLAGHWACGSVLQSFDVVILLPIERRHLFPITGTPSSLKDFFKIWNIGSDMPSEKVLIIISGHSGSDLRSNTKENKESKGTEKKYQNEWLSLIRDLGLPYLIVSNQCENLNVNPRHRYPISLEPFNMGIQHLRGREGESTYTLPGSVIISEAKDAIEQTLFREKEHGTILSIPEWHQEIFNIRELKDLSRCKVTIPYIYPAIRIQSLLKMTARAMSCDFPSPEESKSSDNEHAEPIILSTPEQWFCAAIMHQTVEGEYACYSIGNHLVVRNLGNHYIALIPNENLKNPSNPLSDLPDKAFIKEMLENLISQPNFETFDTATIKGHLEKIKNDRSRASQQELPKKDFMLYKNLLKLIDKNDPKTQRYTQNFTIEKTKEITYHQFQTKINQEEISSFQGSITKAARDVLSGVHLPYPNFTVAISTSMIAETSRYELSFLVMLCLLDLIEADVDNEKKYWSMMFAHSLHYAEKSPFTSPIAEVKQPMPVASIGSMPIGLDQSQNVLVMAMISDIAHLLGGYQVMSHGNSRRQTNPQNAQPEHGIHWVDFKAHLILIQWLALIIEREKSLNPHLTGSLLSTVKEPVYLDTFDRLRDKAGGISREPHLFDRFSRRVMTFNNMLISQEPIRETFNYQENFQNWVDKQSYAVAARIRFPKRPGRDPLQLAIPTFFSCLSEGVLGLDRKKETNMTLLNVTLNKNCSVLSSEQELLEIQGHYLDSVMMADPDFYPVYIFRARLVAKMGFCSEAIKLLATMKERTKGDDKNQYYLNVADKMLNEFKLMFGRIQQSLPPLDKRTAADWNVYLLKAQLNNMTKGPTSESIANLKIYLNGIRGYPDIDCDICFVTAYLDQHSPGWKEEIDWSDEVSQLFIKYELKGLTTYNCEKGLRKAIVNQGKPNHPLGDVKRFIQLVLKYGDINAKSPETKKTALDFAQERGQEECITLLLKAGALEQIPIWDVNGIKLEATRTSLNQELNTSEEYQPELDNAEAAEIPMRSPHYEYRYKFFIHPIPLLSALCTVSKDLAKFHGPRV